MAEEKDGEKSRELAPVTKNLDIVSVAAVPQDKELAIREAYLSLARESFGKAQGAGVSVSQALFGTALVTLHPFLFVLYAPAALLVHTMAAVDVADRQEWRKRNVKASLAHMKDSLKNAYIDAQREAFEHNRKTLVDAADRHVTRGGLLDEKTLSYLAAVPLAYFEKASDELAITVAQARRILAYRREGGKNVAKAMTFANASLDPALDIHRRFLRENLERNDVSLREDALPAFREPPEFAAFEKRCEALQKDRMSIFRYYFTGMFATRRNRRNFVEGLEIPALPPVEVPPLSCIGHFSDMLAAYEADAGPADLPALRGWGKGRGRKPGLLPRPA